MWLDYRTNDKNAILRDINPDLQLAGMPANLKDANTLRIDSLLLRLNCILLFVGAVLALNLLFLLGIHQQISSASNTQLEMTGQISIALDDVRRLLKGSPPSDPSTTKWTQTTIFEKNQTSNPGTLSTTSGITSVTSTLQSSTYDPETLELTVPTTAFDLATLNSAQTDPTFDLVSTFNTAQTEPTSDLASTFNTAQTDPTPNLASTFNTHTFQPTIPYKRLDPVVILNEVGSRKQLYNCSRLCTSPSIFTGELLYKNKTFIAYGTREARFAKKSVAYEALKEFHPDDAQRVELDPDNWHTAPPNCYDEYKSTANPSEINLCGK